MMAEQFFFPSCGDMIVEMCVSVVLDHPAKISDFITCHMSTLFFGEPSS